MIEGKFSQIAGGAFIVDLVRSVALELDHYSPIILAREVMRVLARARQPINSHILIAQSASLFLRRHNKARPRDLRAPLKP